MKKRYRKDTEGGQRGERNTSAGVIGLGRNEGKIQKKTKRRKRDNVRKRWRKDTQKDKEEKER